MERPFNAIVYLFVVVGILLLTAFQEVPTKGQLIKEEIARRLADYEARQKEKCQGKVFEKAGQLVDSTLIARARLKAKEIVPKPEIPFRPERPEVKVPKDTTPVVPILPIES